MLFEKFPTITTSLGAPIADNQNSLTAGPFGPVLMQIHLRRCTFEGRQEDRGFPALLDRCRRAGCC
jgi:hypothetical protein